MAGMAKCGGMKWRISGGAGGGGAGESSYRRNNIVAIMAASAVAWRIALANGSQRKYQNQRRKAIAGVMKMKKESGVGVGGESGETKMVAWRSISVKNGENNGEISAKLMA